MTSIREARESIVRYGRRLLEAGLVVGSEGNLSLRIPKGLLITPSSVRYEEMRPEDVVLVGMDGSLIEGDRNPSVETPTHLAVYRARPDVAAVVHSHPVHATALAVLRKPLPPILDELVVTVGGQVEVADYAMFGTEELAENVVKALGERKAVLMANHGLLTCGSSLEEAFQIAVLVERASRSYLLALAAGTPHLLPDDVVEEEVDLYNALRRMRSQSSD